jgi:uncharacterized DUF497 family protein
VHTTVHIIAPVAFEWDEVKARANYRKHSVHFADAVSVFEDDVAITIPDDDSDEENVSSRSAVMCSRDCWLSSTRGVARTFA